MEQQRRLPVGDPPVEQLVSMATLGRQGEVPEVRTEFARWLGMPEARPDLVVRFGRAPALPMSLRLPGGAVLAA